MEIRKVAVALVVALACIAGTATAFASGGRGDGALAGPPIVLYNQSDVGAFGHDHPELPNGVKAAVAWINAHGGINGRPLDVQYCNTNFEANQALACVRNAIANPDIVAQVGSLGAGLSGSGNALLGQAQMIQVGNDVCPCDYQNKWDFPVTGAFYTATVALPFFMKQRGIKSFIVVGNDAPTIAVPVSLMKAAAKKAGVKFLGFVTLPNTPIPDYTPFALKVKNMNADAAFFYTSANPILSLYQAATTVGLKTIPIVTTATIGIDEAKALGPAAEGMMLSGAVPPASDTASPLIKEWRKEEAAVGLNPDAERSYGVISWLSVYALADVLKEMKGPITRQTVWSKFLSLKDKTYDLWGVKWTPNLKGPPIYPRLGGSQLVWNATVKNGQVVLADPKQPPVDIWKVMGFYTGK
jgi:branched-chain amino acid transport system substrate-binding protein